MFHALAMKHAACTMLFSMVKMVTGLYTP